MLTVSLTTNYALLQLIKENDNYLKLQDLLVTESETEAMLDPPGVGQGSADEEDSEPEMEDIVTNDESYQNNEMEEDPEPTAEPTQEDIEAWMSPEKAREKQRQLDCQRRRVSRLGQQLKTHREMGEKWKAQNARLRNKSKCEKMRRLAAEKTMNDILKMLDH